MKFKLTYKKINNPSTPKNWIVFNNKLYKFPIYFKHVEDYYKIISYDVKTDVFQMLEYKPYNTQDHQFSFPEIKILSKYFTDKIYIIVDECDIPKDFLESKDEDDKI